LLPSSHTLADDLLARLRAGDRRAFDELYASYERRIYGFLYRLSGRRDLADDLFQECWMRVARHAPSLREDTDLTAWLFTIARNLYRSHQRFAIFDRLRARELPTQEIATPEREVAARQALLQLERALGLVTPAAREILLLVGVEHLEPSQAALVLGVSAEAARQRLSRARRELSEHLARTDSEGKRA
jgi:RNA polymerase sigma-70 factor (ECF subfamily)